jgi:hypothetical protein
MYGRRHNSVPLKEPTPSLLPEQSTVLGRSRGFWHIRRMSGIDDHPGPGSRRVAGDFGAMGSTIFWSDQITGRSATLREVAQYMVEWPQAEHRVPADGRELRRPHLFSETTRLQT